MLSDGDFQEAVRKQRRVVNVRIEALDETLEDALLSVDPLYRDAIRAQVVAEVEAEKRFHRKGATVPKGGLQPWSEDWDPQLGYHWVRLREYLVDRKGRSPRDVEKLDDSSSNVLYHLHDPSDGGVSPEAEFKTQGLVLGYVQSGKTANFTALIAKAADRGYRLVIVLSGIHNSLRSQTQRRLDLELGLVDDLAGVGMSTSEQSWWSLTSAEVNGDFKPGADSRPLERGIRGIMVIKKNATVLKRLLLWLDKRSLKDLPVLIIDDEADQASINTVPSAEDADLGVDGGDPKDLDPSTINGLIRKLLERFRRVAYVAYTATPFANVLIDPDIDDEDYGSDLFPNDFIISLERAAAYVGAERVFGRRALDHEANDFGGMDIVRLIPADEMLTLKPPARVTSTWRPAITPSMVSAMTDWILATAAKKQRLGPGISTMLIHLSQRVDQQNDMHELVDQWFGEFRRSYRYDSATKESLRSRWNQEFRPVTTNINLAWDVEYTKIEPFVDDLLSGANRISIIALNSSSKSVLDYEANPELNVVLIGGNKLSRGLTLEDLLVSFYVRESGTYDTLLQMGRWFGYRGQFIDLTRLWTTEELVSRFRHLALVEEDLRDQIEIYERDGLTPRELAPKIMAHPAMQVVARNRMGSAHHVRQSYQGELIQMTRFMLHDDAWLQANFQFAADLLSSLGIPDEYRGGGENRPYWTGVPWDTHICAFLDQFNTYQDSMSFDSRTAARYIRKQAESHMELVSWNVVVLSSLKREEALGDCDFASPALKPLPYISRSRLAVDSSSIGALVTTSSAKPASADEASDLTTDEVDAAVKERGRWPTLGHALRAQRPTTTGLLMIYPISPNSKPGSTAKEDNRRDLFDDPLGRPPVIGIAMSFPPSNTGASVEYVMGKPSRDSIHERGR